MVKKGSYHVNDPEGQPAVQDSSYKSFLCILLVFTAFCVLIIVFSSFNWFKKRDKEPLERYNNVEAFDSERYIQGKEQPKPSSTSKVPGKTKTTPKTIKEDGDYDEYTNERNIPEHKDKEQPKVVTEWAKPETRKPSVFIEDDKNKEEESSEVERRESTTESKKVQNATEVSIEKVVTHEEQKSTKFEATTKLVIIKHNTSDFNTTTKPISVIDTSDTTELTEYTYENISESTERQTDKVVAQTVVTVIYYDSAETIPDTTTTESSKVDRLGIGKPETTTKLLHKITTELPNETTTENIGSVFTAMLVETTNQNVLGETTTESPTETTTENIGSVFTTLLNKRTDQNVLDETTTALDKVMQGRTVTTGQTTTPEQLSTTEAEEIMTTQNEMLTTEQGIAPDTTTEQEISSTTIQTFVLSQQNKPDLTTTPKDADETSGEVFGEASPEDNDVSNSKIQKTTTSTTTSKTPLLGSTTTQTSSTSTTKTAVTSATSMRLKNKFKMAVSHMLGLMDHTTDMCEDFYWYSCGAATENSLPSYKQENSFRELLKKEINNPTKFVFTEKMNLFYKTCVDHEALFDYEERLNNVKGLVRPLVIDNPTKENLTKLFAEMVLTNSLPIMDVDIDVDKETKEYVFQLSPPYRSLTRPEEERWSSLYNTDSNCAKKLLQERFDSPYLNLDQIYKDYTSCTKDFRHYLLSLNVTKKAVDFLSKLGSLEFLIEDELLDYIKDVDTSEVRDNLLSKTHETQTVADLQKSFDSIDWKLFFESISGQNLTDSLTIFVFEKDTLYKIFKNLGVIMINHSYNNFLGVYINDVYQNSVIPKATDTREEYCTNLVNYFFSDVSSYLYLKDLSGNHITKAKEVANEIFNILRSNLLSHVHDTSTIEDEDKKNIEDAITALAPHFMKESDECISELSLKRRYQDMTFGKSYISQSIGMRVYKNRRKFELVGQEFKEDHIFCHFVQPYDLKPKSFYFSSKIAIPYAFLLPWSKDYPGYFLMAKVGTSIATEIGKLFNKVGLSYVISDPDIIDSLKSEVAQEFYVVQERNMSMMLSETKNLQSIGDNAGFRLLNSVYNKTHSLYKELPWVERDFTDEAIFLIAAAQEFCESTNALNYMLHLYEGKTLPNYWRLNNMIINTKKFREVFSCKYGCNMNPSGANHLAFPEISDDEY